MQPMTELEWPALLYRANKLEKAVVQLNQAVKLSEGKLVMPLLFLAMAHQRLKHPDEARDWLAKGTQRLEQWTKEQPLAPWDTRLILGQLGAEAEALIGRKLK